MSKVFKIRDSVTGLFSSGGYFPSWTSEGKSWNKLEGVTSALKLYLRDQYTGEEKGSLPKSWTVVEVEVKVTFLSEVPAADLVKRYVPPPKKRRLRRR